MNVRLLFSLADFAHSWAKARSVFPETLAEQQKVVACVAWPRPLHDHPRKDSRHGYQQQPHSAYARMSMFYEHHLRRNYTAVRSALLRLLIGQPIG